MMIDNVCKICSSELSPAIPDLFEFPNVTSDCRPWQAGRSIAMCAGCGVMQRMLLPEVASAFDDVYADYEMFKHSASASDQMNFNRGGIPEGRTQKILRFIEERLPEKPSKVLDIGSGSGAGLIALGQQFPSADVYGFEPNDKPAERQQNLPDNVVSILNRRPDGAEQYDLVTLFHVFEHIKDVFELLDYIASVLSDKGHLLIQVPYPITGPFDFVIADHIWHFTKKSLVYLFNKANYKIIYLGNEVIEKELTVLASPGKLNHVSLDSDEIQQSFDAIRWLIQYKLFLDSLKNDKDVFVIYGTGPAGAWADQILGDKVIAYIDDDPARVNSTFNSKPVLSVEEIDGTMPVIAPFPDYQERWIAGRNKDLNIVLFGNSPYAKALTVAKPQKIA